jgi:hypothetical protein
MIEDLELVPDQYQYHHARGRICFGIQLMYKSFHILTHGTSIDVYIYMHRG